MSKDNTSRSRRKYQSPTFVWNSQYQNEHSFSIISQQYFNSETDCLLEKVLTETTKKGLGDAKMKRNKIMWKQVCGNSRLGVQSLCYLPIQDMIFKIGKRQNLKCWFKTKLTKYLLEIAKSRWQNCVAVYCSVCYRHLNCVSCFNLCSIILVRM